VYTSSVTCNPEDDEKLHGGRFVVAYTHGVDLLQTAREILAHLLVEPVQRLDVLDPRQAQLALFYVTVSEDHAQEEQVGCSLSNELDPRCVDQLSYL